LKIPPIAARAIVTPEFSLRFEVNPLSAPPPVTIQVGAKDQQRNQRGQSADENDLEQLIGGIGRAAQDRAGCKPYFLSGCLKSWFSFLDSTSYREARSRRVLYTG
jgi:hypothetical protein